MNKSKNWISKCKSVLSVFEHEPIMYFVDFDNLDDTSKNIYLNCVEKKLSLSILKDHLNNNFYRDQTDFFDEFRLLFKNAIKFDEERRKQYPGSLDVGGLAKYLLKKLEKEIKSKFEKSGSSTAKIALLFSEYLQILRNRPNKKNNSIIDIRNLGEAFLEPSLTILSEELNEVSTEENYNELCSIINTENSGKDQSIELAELPKETIDQLWDFVKKYKK